METFRYISPSWSEFKNHSVMKIMSCRKQVVYFLHDNKSAESVLVKLLSYSWLWVVLRRCAAFPGVTLIWKPPSLMFCPNLRCSALSINYAVLYYLPSFHSTLVILPRGWFVSYPWMITSEWVEVTVSEAFTSPSNSSRSWKSRLSISFRSCAAMLETDA